MEHSTEGWGDVREKLKDASGRGDMPYRMKTVLVYGIRGLLKLSDDKTAH